MNQSPAHETTRAENSSFLLNLFSSKLHNFYRSTLSLKVSLRSYVNELVNTLSTTSGFLTGGTEMTEDEKTLAQKVEALEKENSRQRIDYNYNLDEHRKREMMANRENEQLKFRIRTLYEDISGRKGY
jgi:hypothetical protein